MFILGIQIFVFTSQLAPPRHPMDPWLRRGTFAWCEKWFLARPESQPDSSFQIQCVMYWLPIILWSGLGNETPKRINVTQEN